MVDPSLDLFPPFNHLRLQHVDRSRLHSLGRQHRPPSPKNVEAASTRDRVRFGGAGRSALPVDISSGFGSRHIAEHLGEFLDLGRPIPRLQREIPGWVIGQAAGSAKALT